MRGISNLAIFAWCWKRKPDFMFLQETHWKKDTEIFWKNEWGTEIVMSHGGSLIHAELRSCSEKVSTV